jgi:hypothetical protein
MPRLNRAPAGLVVRIRVTDLLDLLPNGLTATQVIEDLTDPEPEDIDACLAGCQSAAQSSGGRRMIIWIDARLSPALARRFSETFGVTTHALRDLGLREAKICLPVTPHGRLLW